MNASGVIALEVLIDGGLLRRGHSQEETKTEDLKAEEPKSEETGMAKPDEVKMNFQPPKPEYNKHTPKPPAALLKSREDCKAAEAYFK
jgi:hypothetical protein